MAIKSLKPKAPPAATRDRRMTLAVEPRVAELIRHVIRHEHILLSEFLEQAVIAWLRRWRPNDYSLEVEGPEGPPARTNIVALGSGEGPWTVDDDEGDKPAVGVASRITRAEVDSMAGFHANPSKKRPRSTKSTKSKK